MKKFFVVLLSCLITCLMWGQQPPAASTIEFVVNTDTIMQNENYNNFINNILPFIKYNSDAIENVILIGSASPEGDKRRNVQLANMRVTLLKSIISDYVPNSKIIVNTDYNLFLYRTRFDEADYSKLRATYIEITLKQNNDVACVQNTVFVTDTIHLYHERVDTVYIEKTPKITPILAIKTNMALDIFANPNVQAELYTHLWGLSLEFEYMFPWYKSDNKFFYYQILNGTAGIRKYLNKSYKGYFVGVYGNTMIYDICLFSKDKGFQGEGYGAGLTCGYVFTPKKNQRLKFEVYVRIGWLNTRYDEYHASNGKYYYNWTGSVNDFVPRRFNMNYYGPTMVGFNITYDLICLRKF